MKNRLLLFGSVVSPCPPQKQGGTERVAYYQAKSLAKLGLQLIFVGAIGTKEAFKQQLRFEQEKQEKQILERIEFVEIGGGTGYGNQADSLILDPKQTEASRKLRLEMVNLALVQTLMIQKKDEYNLILNNLRGEAALIPLAKQLQKPFINVMHLNLFKELSFLFAKYKTKIITISNTQQKNYPKLNYLSTIYNPIHTQSFPFNDKPKNYAFMLGTIGYHKNQLDAIKACQKAKIPLIISGKIRDRIYFEQQIKPFIDNQQVTFFSEINMEKKLKLYREAKVFIFPISWQEPFGLVVIEALACGTPVIAYPHGGPAEIIKNGVNGYLVNDVNTLATKIKIIEKISREKCRKDCISRFDDEIIGKQYFKVVKQVK